MLSSPYDDLKAWEQIIQEQLDRNVTRFRGPPGLWERLAALHAEATGQAVVPAPSRLTVRVNDFGDAGACLHNEPSCYIIQMCRRCGVLTLCEARFR